MGDQSFRTRSSTAGPLLYDPFAGERKGGNVVVEEAAVAEDTEEEDEGEWSDISV